MSSYAFAKKTQYIKFFFFVTFYILILLKNKNCLCFSNNLRAKTKGVFDAMTP